MGTYFKDIQEGIRTTLIGLKLTLRHFLNARRSRPPINVQEKGYFEQNTGIVTLQYPFESIPVPDNGRYRLHNEMDDCIVCDKCAKICPVDCITIDPIKATGEIAKASDGSPIRLYAAAFDIDMAKCCYCGLCTTVCPTECLTMTKAYDFSELELSNMTYHFSTLSPDQAQEKRQLLEQFQREKEDYKTQQITTKTATAASTTSKSSPDESSAIPKRPVFRPSIKPPASQPDTTKSSSSEELKLAVVPKPTFQPTKKSRIAPPPATTPETSILASEESIANESPSISRPKSPFRPKMKPTVNPNPPENQIQTDPTT